MADLHKLSDDPSDIISCSHCKGYSMKEISLPANGVPLFPSNVL